MGMEQRSFILCRTFMGIILLRKPAFTNGLKDFEMVEKLKSFWKPKLIEHVKDVLFKGTDEAKNYLFSIIA